MNNVTDEFFGDFIGERIATGFEMSEMEENPTSKPRAIDPALGVCID